MDTNNRLWACGANSDGVLGQGNNNTYYNFVEVKIDGLDLNSTEIELYPTKVNKTQYSSLIIKTNNGRIYGAGTNYNGNFGIGTNQDYNKFIELSKYNEIWKNAEIIYNQGIISFIITEDGTLYGAGYNNVGTLGLSDNINRNILTQIKQNVINVSTDDETKSIFLLEDGYLYITDDSGNLNRIDGVQDTEFQFLGGTAVISNNQYYKININTNKLERKYNSYEISNESINLESMTGFISNNKIYLDGQPNITKPKAKSIYQLKKVFSGAQFVQNGGNNINIVDNDGNIYEGINNKNTDVSNIKQLVSSNRAQFALSNDGKLYAKGSAYMWGDEIAKSNYTIITKDGNEEFNNIDKVFAIINGYGCIFTTKENEVYWGGISTYVEIPGIKGAVATTGGGNRTTYPEKVENEVINSIVDKIKDIKFTYINEAGIRGGNTLILTTDGKLYTYSYNNNMTGVGKTSDFTEIKFDGTTVEQIETLDGLSLAVLSNGEVYGWGYNTYGILGDGYELGRVYSTPVKLNLSNIRTMSLGDGFAIFGTYAGEVYGIGENDYGQLGTGDNKGVDTFVRCEELEK